MTGTSMWLERQPLWKSPACSLDCGIDIGRRALGNAGNLFTSGRIESVEERAVCGLMPDAIDKVSEPASVTIQPGQCVFGVLWRRAIVHFEELFRYTHATVARSLRFSKNLRGIRAATTFKSYRVPSLRFGIIPKP